jgi:hypothetical protein
LLMTESSMATGCDVTESDVIRSKVGDSPSMNNISRTAKFLPTLGLS